MSAKADPNPAPRLTSESWIYGMLISQAKGQEDKMKQFTQFLEQVDALVWGVPLIVLI